METTHFRKGDIVDVHAIVETQKLSLRDRGVAEATEIVAQPSEADQKNKGPSKIRVMVRLKARFEGIVVGRSLRQTGIVYEGNLLYPDEFELPYLGDVEYHRVVMVQPLNTQRWLTPSACLPEDLELLQQMRQRADYQEAVRAEIEAAKNGNMLNAEAAFAQDEEV